MCWDFYSDIYLTKLEFYNFGLDSVKYRMEVTSLISFIIHLEHQRLIGMLWPWSDIHAYIHKRITTLQNLHCRFWIGSVAATAKNQKPVKQAKEWFVSSSDTGNRAICKYLESRYGCMLSACSDHFQTQRSKHFIIFFAWILDPAVMLQWKLSAYWLQLPCHN